MVGKATETNPPFKLAAHGWRGPTLEGLHEGRVVAWHAILVRPLKTLGEHVCSAQ